MLAGEVAAPRALVRAAYNVSLYACSAAAAGVAISLVTSSNDVALGVAAVFGSAAFYAVDVGFLAVVIAASRRGGFLRVLYDLARSTFAPFVTMATTTAVLVFVWEESAVATVFLVPPLVTIVLYQRRLHASLERQRELDRLKDEFVAVVSHELRTPLASVYGGVETLRREDLTAAQRAAVLGVVRTEGARLARLVDDVLWVSRLRTPAQEPAVGRCDAAAIVDEVVAAAAASAPATTPVSAVHAAEAFAAVDADQLRRVVQNLVDNAIKYSPDGGEVVVSCAPAADGMVEVGVADEGIGVPADQRDAIFGKFSRLDPQMGRGIGGTGLGLYICRELVGQMGGTIAVDDNPSGRGSVFTVRSRQPKRKECDVRTTWSRAQNRAHRCDRPPRRRRRRRLEVAQGDAGGRLVVDRRRGGPHVRRRRRSRLEKSPAARRERPARGGRQLDSTCQSDEIEAPFHFGVAGPRPSRQLVNDRGTRPTHSNWPSLQRPGNFAHAGSGGATSTSSNGVTAATSSGPSGCDVPVRSTTRSCASWISRVARANSGRSRYFRMHSANFVDGVAFVK